MGAAVGVEESSEVADGVGVLDVRERGVGVDGEEVDFGEDVLLAREFVEVLVSVSGDAGADGGVGDGLADFGL